MSPLIPPDLFITFRVARRSPDNPGELESMVLVPDGVLHPEWSASIPVDNGVAPPPPMSLVCCDITLERFAGAGKHSVTSSAIEPGMLTLPLSASDLRQFKYAAYSSAVRYIELIAERPTHAAAEFGPRSSNRARLASFPHSIFWPADAPQPPSGSATGVTTVSVSLLQQVEHQLQERILQEAFLLAERVRAADDHSMKLLRVVDEDELDLLRQGQPLRGQNNGASPSKVMAFFDARSTPDDMANFFTDAARNEFISSQLRGGKKEKTAQALSIKDLPSHSTCPLLDGGVPVYALRALLPQEKLDLLIRLFDIIEPTAAGSPTRALQTSASLLGEHGLDPYPLFCAVQRLALFKPETLAWPPAQRRKLWRLVHENRDEDLDAIRKADEADAAARLPLTPDGQIDVRAILGGKKTSARQSRQESE